MRTCRIAGLLVVLLALAPAAAGCAVLGGSRAHRGGRAPTRPRTVSATVVGLGDSVMSGYHCDCGGPVTAYAVDVENRDRVHVRARDLGVAGATTTDLAAQLRRSGTVADVVSARVVLVIIGANDLAPSLQAWRTSGCPSSCYGPQVDRMGRHLDAVLARVHTLRAHSRGVVLVADYWNVFPDGAPARSDGGEAEIAWGRRVTRSADTTICAAARANGAVCVDTYAPFLAGGDPSRYLVADGDHPDKAGVDLIARALLAATPASVFGS